VEHVLCHFDVNAEPQVLKFATPVVTSRNVRNDAKQAGYSLHAGGLVGYGSKLRELEALQPYHQSKSVKTFAATTFAQVSSRA
jgi:hypothetical protein